MNRRILTIILSIAAIISAIICYFFIDAGHILWGSLSGVITIASIIGYSLCSRCPHCGRIINCTFFRSTIHCRYCGEKVDLNEGILH